jgi:hypothetical protein
MRRQKIVGPCLISFAVLTTAFIRLFILPGVSFNQSIWDDEIGWLKDSLSRSALEYIVYRDAPGYFVLVPRMVLLIGNYCPEIGPFSSFRVLVTAIQLLCSAAAAACIRSKQNDWKIWLLVFSTLSLTFVEDINYIHNFGYMFIFPIFFLVFKPLVDGLKVSHWRTFIAALLISKPFTAVLIFCLVLLFMAERKKWSKSLSILGIYSLIYLGCFFFLPNRLHIPSNTDPSTLLKAIVDLPWILFSTINPAISIGGMGLVQVLGTHITIFITIIGTSSNLTVLFAAVKYRAQIRAELWSLTLLTKSFLLIFAINYLLEFTSADSSWLDFFPLYFLESPERIWMRRSSALPFIAILVIASIPSLGQRFKKGLYLYISLQWILLTLIAGPWLRRYW